jgi:hypothetical protein
MGSVHFQELEKLELVLNNLDTSLPIDKDILYNLGITMREAAERRDEWGTNYLGEILMLVRQRLKERGSV